MADAIEVGTIRQGRGGVRYVFLGGDSTDKSRWQPLPTPDNPAQVPSFAQSYQQELASRSPLEKFNAGWGILPTQIYEGLKQANVGAHIARPLGATDQQQIEGYKALGSTGPGFAGNMAANIATLGPLYGKLLGTPAGASQAPVDVGARIASGGLLGATQGFLTSPGERGAGTEAGATGGMLGSAMGEALNARAAEKIASSQQAQIQNALRDQITTEAQAAGFKIPPAESNPTIANRAASGLVGKQTIPQMASTANDKVVQKLAADAVGLPVVTPNNLMAARKEANKAYEALRKYGQFTVDDEFVRNTAKIGEENLQTSQVIPSMLNEQVQKLTKTGQDLGGSKLDSNAVVSAINRLRAQADKNFAGDAAATELAVAQRKMANEFESLIERNLSSNPQAASVLAGGKGRNVLQDFQAARTQLAKLHVIDAAMNEATGRVNPLIIGKQLQAGEPLSGPLATIGRVALTYPSALQQNLKGNIGLPYSALDLGLGLLGSATGAALGGPAGGYAGAGLALSRPVVAGGMLAAQKMIGTPSYLQSVPTMSHPLLGPLSTLGALEAGRK